MTLGVAHKTNK